MLVFGFVVSAVCLFGDFVVSQKPAGFSPPAADLLALRRRSSDDNWA